MLVVVGRLGRNRYPLDWEVARVVGVGELGVRMVVGVVVVVVVVRRLVFPFRVLSRQWLRLCHVRNVGRIPSWSGYPKWRGRSYRPADLAGVVFG